MQLFAMFSGKRAVKHALTGCGGLLCVTRLYVNSFLSEHGKSVEHPVLHHLSMTIHLRTRENPSLLAQLVRL